MELTVRGGLIDSVRPGPGCRLSIDGRELGLPDGAVVLPGLVDTHCHLSGLGEMAFRVQLQGARSVSDCMSRVALRAISTRDGEWILGFGWNETEWLDGRRPDRLLLDSVAPDHPVALIRVDGHAAWVNTRALEEARIEPREIEGGEIVLAEDGRPSGLLVDRAIELVRAVFPKPTLQQRRSWIAYAVDQCVQFGITEVHDMDVPLDTLAALQAASNAGELPIRVSAFLQAEHGEWRSYGGPRKLGTRLDVVGVKFYADGALGSRGALLLEPYADAEDTSGLALSSIEELVSNGAEAIEVGHAVATHAIGDAANRMVLDAYAELRRRYPEALLRIEHAQIVHPDDVVRFRELDVIAAVQPTHCTSDASMAEARLGPERCTDAYRWRSLIDAGATIIAGSDFPIESPDPLAGLRAFHYRAPVQGGDPWFPDERISRGEALDAFTRDAPLGLPGATNRGRLEPGCAADLTILSADPFDDPGAVVLATVVGGAVVFEA